MSLRQISCIAILIFGQAFTVQVICQETDYKSRCDSIQKNILLGFRSPDPDLFIESTDTSRDKNPYSYLWPVCALMQAENELEALGRDDCLAPVLRTISHYYDPSQPAPGYQAYVSSAGKDTRYYDDNQWIGIAAADAYARTGEKSYQELAKTICNFMMTGYDTISGGGIYWREGDFTTKNTCSNGPGIILALRLYQFTHKKEYLENAKKIYNWTNKYLRSPGGIYYDALKVKTMKIDSATYTYNTGTMLQSNVLFYLLTTDRKYLEEAELIALSAEKHFYKNGKLPNNYWFNAVMLRGFAELSKADGNYERLKFFADDAERIWATQKDVNGLVGRRSRKTLIDQAAMLEIFARLGKLSLEGKL
ncbi:MAG TPA: glycoside hydrolase family 76 protein [Bacteroidales bacterium]|nr:glycoside hydrolase family 76 protein [Bacteroidales bacterium]